MVPAPPSMRGCSAWRALVALMLLTLACACGSVASGPQNDASGAKEPASPESLDVAVAPAEAGPIPVGPTDPARGHPLAPVTIVVFSDFQCRYCASLSMTMLELERSYGPGQLRVVYKHFPLDFHPFARPAAELAAAVHEVGGAKAFWAFHDEIFSLAPESTEQKAMRGVARAAEIGGFAGAELNIVARTSGAAKVDSDVELGTRLGVRGTPATFVNGIMVSGAESKEHFEGIIDAELEAARGARIAGVPAAELYALRTTQNLDANARDSDSASEPEPRDDAVYYVPVAGSPVRGASDALVTVVVFSEFQCPFCKKVLPTLASLEKRYGDKLRVVFKHGPLEFHEWAEPAAELSIEIFKKKGNDAFWKAHDALFAEALDARRLEAVAIDAGLDPKMAMREVKAKRHGAVIDADLALADDIEAKGTPHFFINGKRLVGAQPLGAFTEIIDAELVRADALVRGGTAPASVYDEIMKGAVKPPVPEKLAVDPPTKQNPARGPTNAPVVVQVFSDFECPFCARLEPTLAELEKAFPNKVRIVWRHMPLTNHKHARLAAVAAMEAKRQKGDAGFWQMHGLLFGAADPLDRQSIEAMASKVGLDMTKLRAALDGTAHDKAIDADIALADRLGVNGTPATFINGYLVTGAQPLSKLKKMVALALKDKAGSSAAEPKPR